MDGPRSPIQPTLYIFTLTYPFSGSAEDNFLRTEIAELIDQFRIVIVPRKQVGLRSELPRGCSLDLSFSELVASEKPKGLARIRRLFSLEVLRELITSLPKSAHPSYLKRIVSDHLLGDYGKDWFAKFVLGANQDQVIICGWWLTPEILSIARTSKKKQTILSHRKIHVVSRAHGGDLYEFRDSPPGKPFRQNQIHFLDAVFPDSKRGVEYLTRMYPAIRDVTSVAHLGTEDFGQSPTPLLRDEHFTVMSCSFVDPVKQLGLALEGLKLFARRNVNLRITWNHVGDGDLGQIVNLLKPIPANLEIISSPYPGIAALRKYYQTQELTVFINTSKSEGVPVAMMEAASCAIPLIGPDIGGVSEIVKHGVNGFLMKPVASAEGLAKSLQSLFDLTNEAELGLRHNSRRLWEEFFNSKATYIKFANQLSELMRAGGSH